MSIYTSLLTAGTNSHQETSENANAIATDFVSQGVIGAITNTSGVAPSTGAFAVNAQGTPNMTVAVSSGVAYVTATPSSQNSQTLRVRNSASANVTISANSSGSTKYDWLYIKIDATKAAAPDLNADDVATLVTSRSSSSTADNGTPPTYGYCIAVITVANSATSITNGNIADKRVLATSVQDSAVTTAKVADGAVTGAKMAGTYKLSYQTANSNSIANTTGPTVNMQMGWGQILGSGTSSMTQTVTLPTAFTTILGVSISWLGYKSTAGAASSVTGFDSAIGGGNNIGAKGLSATAFTATFNSTGNFGTVYHGYSWIAWGV